MWSYCSLVGCAATVNHGTIIPEKIVNFLSLVKWQKKLSESFSLVILYDKYVAHIWYEWKYCYMKISNTKILQTKSANANCGINFKIILCPLRPHGLHCQVQAEIPYNLTYAHKAMVYIYIYIFVLWWSHTSKETLLVQTPCTLESSYRNTPHCLVCGIIVQVSCTMFF